MAFVGALLVLSHCGYSDGDDAFFYEYAHKMGFLEYLSWRYETWTGRIGAEALVYAAFNLGIAFWRVANSLALVLLAAGILRLSAIAARAPLGSASDWGVLWFGERAPALPGGDYGPAGAGCMVVAAAGYFLMDIRTVGYAVVWVNGSVFYTWAAAMAVYALIPVAEFVYGRHAVERRLTFSARDAEERPPVAFLLSIPLSMAAALSIEQVGAVLLAFEVLAIWYGIYAWRLANPMLIAQAALTLLCYAVLFAAPGNALRVASETGTWMPEFAGMPVGEHLFITAHWLISSFANENRILLAGVWIVGIALLLERNRRGVADWALIGCGCAGIFSALLPGFGIGFLSDMGMQYIDITKRVDRVPRAAELTGQMWAAMAWWGVALVYTLALIWRASGGQAVPALAYLASIASEAILYFSPTMYASGERVYFCTDLLLLFTILTLSFAIRERRRRDAAYALILAAGAEGFIFQAAKMLIGVAG